MRVTNEGGRSNETIGASSARYIRLGSAGEFAKACIHSGVLGLAFPQIPHDLCEARDWDAVQRAFLSLGKSAQKATAHTNELRAFYELDETTLWITFADGRLWWAFAQLGVTWTGAEEGGLPRRRSVVGAWRSTDVADAELRIKGLSTRLTSVRGYQGTICGVREYDYLMRRINAEADPLIAEAEAMLRSTQSLATRLIQGLHEREFELLIDLILASSGWRRVSVLGESEKDVDLLVEQAATNERAFVQVKSRATAQVFDEYVTRFNTYGDVNRLIFACHSPAASLVNRARVPMPPHDIWLTETIAEKAITSGLFGWLIDRAR